jgi:glycosyltransferase involved in cell wall biosynthesis
MRDNGYDVVTMSADGKEVAEIIKDGTKHITIPFTRKITPIHDLICLWQLVGEIKKLRPDIVHTHTPKAGLLGMLAAWICRVPVRLHTVAGLPLMEARGFKRQVLELAERVTYACAHFVYSNSKGLKEYILNNLVIDEEKLRIIGKGSSNGVDSNFFQRTGLLEEAARELRQRYNVGGRDFVFSFVGRIVRDKGIVELVAAFQELSNQLLANDPQRKVLLFMVGHFEDVDPLPTEVLQFLRNDRRVVLAGFQNDVRPWLVASNIFVFPSYREGFPNVVLQASSLEVPCIVTDINGCNEIVSHGKTGLIIPVKNVDALVAAMRTMMEDEQARRAFAQAARKFVVENFKREYIWDELRKGYESLLKK